MSSNGNDASELDESDVRGPHLWWNWQAHRAGQPARASSTEEGDILIRPCWEESGLFSDAHVSGEFEDGPFKLINTLGGSRVAGEATQTFALRSVDHLLAGKPSNKVPSEPDLSGWTGGDLFDQFASLLSLALDRRMRSGGVTRHAFAGVKMDDPLGRPTTSWRPRPALLPSGRDPIIPGIATTAGIDDQCTKLLRGYAALGAEDARALTRAANQYADALWWADADPRISWMKLVGAAETAANRWDQSSASGDAITLLKRHRPKLAEKLAEHGGKALRLVAKDLKGTQKAEAKFLDFMLRFSPDPPTQRPSAARVDFEHLEDALRSVYDWRSRDLHDGIPLPPPMCEAPHQVDGVHVEVFPALAVSQDGGAWPGESLPMHLHMFAYLVGGALRSWWDALIEDSVRAEESPATEFETNQGRAERG